jgi:AraC-like DNA-binding protein/ligand-binding sensor protein
MKNNTGTFSTAEKTHPILLKARGLMAEYARATGAVVCIHGQNYMPIREVTEELLSEKNTCLFCIKHQRHINAKCQRDLQANPCREMHISALSESHRNGGAYIYSCPLGFTFWTSPVYLNEKFIGALSGGGFLGIDSAEACARMYSMCKGAASEAEIKKMLSGFPRAEPKKIKAMAELMLICAQSVSVESEGCHAALKRRFEQKLDLSAKIEALKNQFPQGSPKPEYPMEKEHRLLEALRSGDAESGRHIMNELLAVLFHAHPDQFRQIQYRAIELAVLISRVDSRPGIAEKIMIETNNRNIKSIQEAGDIDELTDVLLRIVDETAGQIASFQGIQHASALKKAKLYILENFTRKISLEEIAKASGFSAPYFSTIFKKEMGENLSGYLNRLRVEKAKIMFADSRYSLSAIAQACGFEDQSWFSKIFKHFTGTSPGKYRSQGGKAVSKISETEFSDDYPAVKSTTPH